MLINFPSLGLDVDSLEIASIFKQCHGLPLWDKAKAMRAETTIMELEIGNTSLQLLPERAVWIPSGKVLIVGDLHFGKVNHFRRAGLPVPLAANIRNAEKLIDLINAWNPLRTIFLGDLFHSVYNDDWEVVGQIVNHFPTCSFELIRGNHDVLSEQQYLRYGIRIHDHMQWDNLVLTHEPMEPEEVPPGMINVSGHIHPAARLVGKGRQALTFPCFWRSANRLVLPAFGAFTGLAVVRPDEKDLVYIIVDDKIMGIQSAERESHSRAS